ncbi:MAG: RnfABCDGE type electron transport complex subunit D [Cyanobacteria bacterium P01_H01_bin.15]
MNLFKDPRDYQILFLAGFLLLGLGTRDWRLNPYLLAVVLSSCLATQLLLKVLTSRRQSDLDGAIQHECFGPHIRAALPSLKSALISALGLCLLLRANRPETMVLAGVLAIASKFIARWRGKHFFNPANFGIIAALLFTPDAWVSPGQWGADGWYLLVFLGAGGLVLKRVGRWDTSAIFLGVYAGLQGFRTIWLGQSWEIWQHQLMSGSLLLFALFMLTDPRSIPDSVKGRIVWATSIAVLTFILQTCFYLPTAVFWALFIISPVTLLLDQYWRGLRFRWPTATQVSSVSTTPQPTPL